MTWEYGLRLRPPMVCTIPHNGLVRTKDFNGKKPYMGFRLWGCVEYDRQLDDSEIIEYELVYLGKRG